MSIGKDYLVLNFMISSSRNAVLSILACSAGTGAIGYYVGSARNKRAALTKLKELSFVRQNVDNLKDAVAQVAEALRDSMKLTEKDKKILRDVLEIPDLSNILNDALAKLRQNAAEENKDEIPIV